jgi:hypothetical protein
MRRAGLRVRAGGYQRLPSSPSQGSHPPRQRSLSCGAVRKRPGSARADEPTFTPGVSTRAPSHDSTYET